MARKSPENKVQELSVVPEDDRPIVKNIIGKTKDDVVEFTRTFKTLIMNIFIQ